MYFEVLKRAFPFLAAFALGVAAAFPFLAVSPNAGQGAGVEELRQENIRLKREIRRLKHRMGDQHRHPHFRLSVPPPPAPPEPPAPPLAPEPPLAR